MVALVLVLVLGAQTSTPTSAVVLTRRTGVSASEGQNISAQLATVLGQAGLPAPMPAESMAVQLKKLGIPDPSSCAGRKRCVTELGKQLAVTWVFSVSVARVDKDRSVGIELVNVEDGTTLEKDAVLLSPGASMSGELLTGFVDRVRARLPAPPKPDAPVAVVTTPVEPPPVEPIVTPPPPPPPAVEPPRSHTASIVLAIVGAAALVGSGVTLTLGLLERRAIQSAVSGDGADRVSSLTFTEATRRNGAANTQLILAGAFGALALALGTIALIVW